MSRWLISFAKWAWFALLLLVGFGYMASGLSKSFDPGDRQVDSDNASDELQATQVAAELELIDQVVGRVNLARQTELEDQEIPSAAAADWMTVCRRMSLALTGAGMSLEEIRALESIPIERRESAHLETLLADSRFHDYWAERFTRYLVGADEGPFIVYRRRRFRVWLAGMLAENQPYDQIVSKLITAEGLWTDRPEVNFLTVTFDSNDGQPDPVRLAARTSRAFLGLRIDCLQCHNDFLGNVNLGDPADPREGMQTDFHQLAAFYSSAKTNGLQGIRTGAPEYQYQYLDSDEAVNVSPAVPFQQELLPDQGDARSRLAAWVTHPDNRGSRRVLEKLGFRYRGLAWYYDTHLTFYRLERGTYLAPRPE